MERKREDESAPQNESEKMNLLLRTIMESFEKPGLRDRAFVKTMEKARPKRQSLRNTARLI